jgi:hypothetical protein
MGGMMKKFLGILVITVLISACGIFGGATKVAPTEGPPPTEVPIDTVEPTAAPVDTDTPEPTATLEPTLPEPSPTIEEATMAVEPTLASEAWRLPPMPGAVLLTNDLVASPDDAKAMAAQGQNLAIPAPFSWDAYTLPDKTRYADVQGYYTPLITKKGYSIGMDVQGANDIYLMTFPGKIDKTSKIGIQFQTKKGDRPAMVLVFYKNPK